MELRHLRGFIAVAETLHFGLAADRLHIAQPALSRTIAQLERELGVSLFTRSTRSVTLTAAGTEFLTEARALLAGLDRASARAHAVGTGQVGGIRLGVTGSATYGYLPRIASVMHRELPGVSLSVETEMLTGAQEDALTDGAIDLGILRPPLRRPELVVVRVEDEPLVVALPPRHRLATHDLVEVADLRDEPFITYGTRSVVLDAVVAACAHAGFTPHRAHEVQATSTMLALVAAGLGVALVPETASSLALPGVTFHPIDSPVTLELALAYAPDRAPATVYSLLDALRRAHVIPAPTPTPHTTPTAQEAT